MSKITVEGTSPHTQVCMTREATLKTMISGDCSYWHQSRPLEMLSQVLKLKLIGGLSKALR